MFLRSVSWCPGTEQALPAASTLVCLRWLLCHRVALMRVVLALGLLGPLVLGVSMLIAGFLV
jgi:hypothetical protein